MPLSLWTDPDALTPAEVTQFRTNMSQLGIDPHRLAHRRRPVTFVDLVHGGRTYENLFLLLRRWIAEDNPAAWPVVRTKPRFIGITRRTKTSPNTWRWYQEPWAAQLPRSAVIGVSLHRGVWSYLGDQRAKTTRSFPVTRWLDQDTYVPGRDTQALAALAEAVAVVAYGRSAQGRAGLVAAITVEPHDARGMATVPGHRTTPAIPRRPAAAVTAMGLLPDNKL